MDDTIKNSVDGRTYQVTTLLLMVGTTAVQHARAVARQTPAIWCHRVTTGGFLGLGARTMLAAVSRDEAAAKAEHTRLVALARDEDPSKWRMTKEAVAEAMATSARLVRELGKANQ